MALGLAVVEEPQQALAGAAGTLDPVGHRQARRARPDDHRMAEIACPRHHQRGQGVGRVAQPSAVLQDAGPLRAQVTHLRAQLAGLLAAVVEVFGQLVVEEAYVEELNKENNFDAIVV